MKVSYKWLGKYFDKPLPTVKKLSELLTTHSFEVESVEPHGKDFVFDIKVLPDRSHDCLSHIGIAKEISVLTKLPLKKEVLHPKELSVPESNMLRVDVEDPILCKRFSALVIENVEVKESPEWLKELLESIGQRSINNIVDATNYVMFSLGQPLHAYDRALLKDENGGYKILVRCAKEGERVVALGEAKYTLNNRNLVICDGNSDSVLGIAAIRGGVATRITKNTKSIVLESANFDAINIRKTAKELGVRTDASVRFENGITPELTTEALVQVSELIFDIAKTDSIRVEGLFDFYPRRANPYKIGISSQEIENCLGIKMSSGDIEKILDKALLAWESVDQQKVIEEHIQKSIGAQYKLGSSVLFDSPKSFDCSSLTSYLCMQAGVAIPRISVDQYVFGEIVERNNLKFGDLIFSNSKEGSVFEESVEWMKGTPVPEGVNHVGIYVGQDYVVHATKGTGTVIKEKIEESKSFQNIVGFRRFIRLGNKYVVTIPKERLDLRIKEDLIEEIGRIYGYENISSDPVKPYANVLEVNKISYYIDLIRNVLTKRGFSEVMTYSFRNEGDIELLNPIASDKAFLRTDITSGLSESLVLNSNNAELLGLSQVKIFEIGNVFTNNNEHTAIAFCIKNIKGYKASNSESDEVEATIKELSENFGYKISFTQKIKGIYELNLSNILSKLPEPTKVADYFFDDDIKFRKISQYPFILRDIAVFVPEDTKEFDVLDMIRKESGELLVQTKLFDIFTKELPEGKRTSYAFRLVFQSYDKTLNDEEINVIMEKVTASLNGVKNWGVR